MWIETGEGGLVHKNRTAAGRIEPPTMTFKLIPIKFMLFMITGTC